MTSGVGDAVRRVLRVVPFARPLVRELRARRVYYRKLLDRPREVLIETTNICNLDCPMCYSRQALREKGFIELDTCRRAIDQAVELDIKDVHLYTVGEPLLHPHIAEMVRIAKEKGRRVFIFTNGALLNPELGEKLIDAGLDCLTFSVEGHEAGRYERTRRGSKFQRLLENASAFRKLRDKRGAPTRIEVFSDVSNETKEELTAFVSFWKQYADGVQLVYLANQGGYIKGIQNSQVLPPAETRRPCSSLWATMVVLWNGEVSVCCVDFEGRLIVGNIFESTLKDIWFGKAYKKYQLWHVGQQFSKMPKCGGCDAGLINIAYQIEELNRTLENKYPRWLNEEARSAKREARSGQREAL
ncbi:MAG: radical SAM protein [Chloroflexi bacterium]|nr:radical SAM protein [Chloroflexota bacterium]